MKGRKDTGWGGWTDVAQRRCVTPTARTSRACGEIDCRCDRIRKRHRLGTLPVLGTAYEQSDPTTYERLTPSSSRHRGILQVSCLGEACDEVWDTVRRC